MKRTFLLFVSACFTVVGAAQPGLFPLSRSMEAPYAARLHHFKTEAHTSFRPYLKADLAGTKDADSLRDAAILPALDRWAGATGSHFRGTPLLDAIGGISAGEGTSPTYRTGLGFWTEYDPHPAVSLHVDGMAWNERFPEFVDTLVRHTQVSPGEGYAYGTGPSFTHYDWNAYVSWTTGRYFNITLGRGRNFIGEGYRSLMLSDNAYSYPYLRITTTAWKVRYTNLYTLMADIRQSDGDPNSFRKKATAIHYLDCDILKRVNVGLFEAIVWQDDERGYPRGYDFNYWNPILFYRPVEYQLGSPDNALLGFAMNIKVQRNTLFYSQLVFDEFLLREVRAGDGWYANKQAFQLGVMAYNAFRRPGLDIRMEFNYVRPFTYSHEDTRQNYAHFNEPLAHPYGANCQEALAIIEQRTGRWSFREHFSFAVLGTDTGGYNLGNDIFASPDDRPPRDAEGRRQNYGYYLGGPTPVQLIYNEVRAGYAVLARAGLSLEASYIFRSRTPDEGDGYISHTVMLGLVCRFHDRYLDQDARSRPR
ncbi:MAG: hypothetical protein H6597_02690 [Flavobacteriales bacterium]|nr:hypothetical protein [Flavobacteriales bacterium]MCB9193413.1 hypothetical protein [Flavobacteriales bacterium]